MKVAVLLSGGIDSTVAGLKLIEQGHEVVGMTMVNWDEKVGRQGVEAARWLGIEHQLVDLRQEFATRVIDYFCAVYEQGDTPNPCVECNKHIKFGILMKMAQQIGCEFIATGHYAQVEFDPGTNRYLLKRGLDNKKDQSYFLYGLTQEQLARIIFPLGNMLKAEVKVLGRQRGLPMAESKESQEICFIAEDYRDFLAGRINAPTGEITDTEGRHLGTHRGLAFYTIGQRKGLGISGGRPLYVVDLDNNHNILKVGQNEDLMQKSLLAKDNNFILFDRLDSTIKVQAKIRYAAQPAEATVKTENEWVRVDFLDAQRAITRGQSVVYYQDDYVVGGGIIC